MDRANFYPLEVLRMSCPNCAARWRMMRDALINAKIAESLGHAVKGAAEVVGVKPKTGLEESRRVRRITPPAEGKE